jgi:hypothetical protein
VPIPRKNEKRKALRDRKAAADDGHFAQDDAADDGHFAQDDAADDGHWYVGDDGHWYDSQWTDDRYERWDELMEEMGWDELKTELPWDV